MAAMGPVTVKTLRQISKQVFCRVSPLGWVCSGLWISQWLKIGDFCGISRASSILTRLNGINEPSDSINLLRGVLTCIILGTAPWMGLYVDLEMLLDLDRAKHHRYRYHYLKDWSDVDLDSE